MTDPARHAAEGAARTSYGKLLSILAARSRDIAAAEDALAEAFATALRVWPATGVPDNPDAWLLSAARRGILNMYRHQRVRDGAAPDLALRQDEAAPDPQPFADDRLKLLFVCAHPAIDVAMRTPLMLQTVLGLDAARIAEVFLIAPAAMGQRLVRAKAKIRDAGLRFDVPALDALSDRLDPVLDAIYAAYGTGWDAAPGAEGDLQGLAAEAIYLGELVVALLPEAPEAKGLLSLMLFCEARRAARRDADGAFVPLHRQDVRLWDRDRIIRADLLLTEASRAGRFGRYMCEAAIQSVHAQRPVTGRANHAALATLYALLAAHHPTVGVRVAQASVMLDAGDPAGALAALDRIEGAEGYQPWWVARGHALAARGQRNGAREAFAQAITLTRDPAVRAYLAGLHTD